VPASDGHPGVIDSAHRLRLRSVPARASRSHRPRGRFAPILWSAPEVTRGRWRGDRATAGAVGCKPLRPAQAAAVAGCHFWRFQISRPLTRNVVPKSPKMARPHGALLVLASPPGREAERLERRRAAHPIHYSLSLAVACAQGRRTGGELVHRLAEAREARVARGSTVSAPTARVSSERMREPSTVSCSATEPHSARGAAGPSIDSPGAPRERARPLVIGSGHQR